MFCTCFLVLPRFKRIAKPVELSEKWRDVKLTPNPYAFAQKQRDFPQYTNQKENREVHHQQFPKQVYDHDRWDSGGSFLVPKCRKIDS